MQMKEVHREEWSCIPVEKRLFFSIKATSLLFGYSGAGYSGFPLNYYFMLLQVKEIHEEEWSYIPVGGPLPLPDQPITAFGAAANLVHPATGMP